MKWIKWMKVDEKNKVIYLPPEMAEKTGTYVNLQYGLRKIKVHVMPSVDDLFNTGDKFTEPIILRCSNSIAEELMIVDTLIYQLIIEENVINIGPVIGFLLGNQYYYYHDRFLHDLTDAMGIYNETGGLFIAFKMTGVNWNEECIYGTYYEYGEQKWKYGKLPFPSVIFRRTFQWEGKDIKLLKKITKGKVFNELKLDKFESYEKLKAKESFRPYLPHTKLLETIQIFNEFIKEYQKVILKPKGLSRGRGICIIEQLQNDWLKINDYRKNKKEFMISNMEVLEFLVENEFFNGEYIIQPYIKLANIDGNVFDTRVVMQKNTMDEWGCTGFECRVAGGGNLLTNIALGGKALTIEETIEMAFRGFIDPEKAKRDMIEIGKEFCHIMDENDGIFAEYGLDIGMDIHGNYWFIEGNFRPAFKGFKSIDYGIYQEICYMTTRYAVSLAGFENRRDNYENKI